MYDKTCLKLVNSAKNNDNDNDNDYKKHMALNAQFQNCILN